jgi:hypothetical protein
LGGPLWCLWSKISFWKCFFFFFYTRVKTDLTIWFWQCQATWTIF